MMKLGNRRRRRDQYLLDVKVQSDRRFRQRARWLTTVVAAVVVLSLTCRGLYELVKFAANRLVFNNPQFAIAQIVVENDGAMTPSQVTQFAGVAVGQNLLAVDLDQVQRNLEIIPLVRNVEVRRMLPQRLFIHVDERIAVARLRGPGRELSEAGFLIDRSGMVMKPLKLSSGAVLQPQALGTLPELTGLTLADVQVGRPVQSEQIFRTLELLDRLQQAAAGSMLEIEAVELSKPRLLTLTTRQKTIVKFDVAEFPQQLRRLSAILGWAAQRQRMVQTVDLTVSRGVPVTFMN
jgi:cell division septal protein FtsQ